jgi:signal transduction histidine kinase
VWITLRRDQDALNVSVQDDGRGFDLEAVQAELKSRGIDPDSGMHGRVKVLQGVLSVESAVGQGTTIRLVSPLIPNLATGS